MTLQLRTVLIDLERLGVGEELLTAGLHPLQLSPARLPCSLHSDDLARLQAYARGQSASCEVVLSFRLQDLDDLGVPTLQVEDCFTGVFDLCGTKLVEMPAGKPLRVAATFVGGSGVSLGRPGRHLLCAHFTSEPPMRVGGPLPHEAVATPLQAATESAGLGPVEAVVE